MSVESALLLLGISALSAWSQFLFREGASRLVTTGGPLRFARSLLSRPTILGALILIFVPLVYLSILRTAELSWANLFSGLNFVFVAIASHYGLRERLTRAQVLGIVLIVGGLVLSSWP